VTARHNFANAYSIVRNVKVVCIYNSNFHSRQGITGACLSFKPFFILPIHSSLDLGGGKHGTGFSKAYPEKQMQPMRSSTWRTSVGEAAAPPSVMRLRLLRSYLGRSGQFTSAVAIVGTRLQAWTFSCSIKRKTSGGSNLPIITCVAPTSVTEWATPHPLAWNSGMVCNSTVSGPVLNTTITFSACR